METMSSELEHNSWWSSKRDHGAGFEINQLVNIRFLKASDHMTYQVKEKLSLYDHKV